jgi:hypothetical protein
MKSVGAAYSSKKNREEPRFFFLLSERSPSNQHTNYLPILQSNAALFMKKLLASETGLVLLSHETYANLST